jgi:hypothetical protein
MGFANEFCEAEQARGIIVVVFLMILFGLAEVVTGFTQAH